MTQTDMAAAAPRPDIAQIGFDDLSVALSLGWRDFRTAPILGMVFALAYVLGGWLLLLVSGGLLWQTLILTLAFPLFAPFAAVGFYDISRRIEQGRALDVYRIAKVVWAERHRQIPWLGAIIVIYFLFYSFFAHMLFALFMGLSVMTNVSSSYDIFLTANGLTMIAMQVGVGGLVALFLFAMTVFSLPLLLDKEVDFITAMLLSIETVRANARVLLPWAALVAGATFVAMVPLFLGLLVALPVLGHATWHLYRRALIHPGD